jgi:hypothetical protein
MPSHTATANAEKALSIAGTALGAAKALASELARVAAADATAALGGTMPAHQLCAAFAHACAHALYPPGGSEKVDCSPLDRAERLSGTYVFGVGGPDGPTPVGC